MTARPPKKSESLEIRIPYPTKQAFMARCQADGVSASEALRGFIEREIQPASPARGGLRRWIAGGLIAAAVGAVALPSLAQTAEAAEFHRLDVDGDGRVSLAELARADRNHDGQLSLAEYRALKR
jgi:hypothetical protein